MTGGVAEVDHGWHLDRRVPVSIIVVLLAQFATGIWVASSMSAQIERNTIDISRVERNVEAITTASQAQAVQLGRIEEQVSGMRNDLQRILRALEQP